MLHLINKIVTMTERVDMTEFQQIKAMLVKLAVTK
jgi:hypothetical protein